MNARELPIAKPCPARWDLMVGGDRQRFCRECRKSVTDLSQMSDADARAYLAANPGSCVRYTKTSSGAVAHKAPCETVARRIARRKAGSLVALGAALWSGAAIAAPQGDQAPGWWTWVETRVHAIAEKVGVAKPAEIPVEVMQGDVAYVPEPPPPPLAQEEEPILMGKVAPRPAQQRN
jgi:hypothetical protein